MYSLPNFMIICICIKLFWDPINQFYDISNTDIQNIVHLKAQLSFSSKIPSEVTSIAKRNSLKSTNPFLSLSNVLKTCSQNSSAFPEGKHLLYIFKKKLPGWACPQDSPPWNPCTTAGWCLHHIGNSMSAFESCSLPLWLPMLTTRSILEWWINS